MPRRDPGRPTYNRISTMVLPQHLRRLARQTELANFTPQRVIAPKLCFIIQCDSYRSGGCLTSADGFGVGKRVRQAALPRCRQPFPTQKHAFVFLGKYLVTISDEAHPFWKLMPRLKKRHTVPTCRVMGLSPEGAVRHSRLKKLGLYIGTAGASAWRV
jgi:hypothetical protein